MAVITPSPLIGSIRGSIGSITFAKNKSNAIVRLKAPVRQSWSTAQLKRRKVFARARALWQELSEDEQLAWKNAAYVMNNRPKKPWPGVLSPFQVFCYIKTTWAMENYADADVPLLHETGAPPVLIVPVARWNSYLTLYVYGAFTAPTARISVFGASPLRTFRPSMLGHAEYRFIGDYAYNTFPRDILDDWKAVWGQPQNLQIGSIRCKYQELNKLPSSSIQDDFYWSTA